MMKKKTKRINRSALILLGGLALVIVVLLLLMQKPVAVPAENLRFPVGENVTLSQVIPEVKGGSLLNPDLVIDSSKEGEIPVLVILKNRIGVHREEEIRITFYKPETAPETEETPLPAPVIQGPETITINAGESLDLASKFTATDHSGKALEIGFVGTYDPAKAGTYSLTAEAVDKEGRKSTFSFTLTVKEIPPVTTQKTDTNTSPGSHPTNGVLPDGEYPTKNGKTVVVKNGLATVDGILIANKSYALPKTYTSSYLTPEAEQAYYRLRDGANAAGFSLPIKSAYRSWNDQNYIFNGYVQRDGLEKALTYSARPGHSEHQTGLAMDLLTASTEESKTAAFKPTLDWLKDNAHHYGFCLRYPEGKSHITGYIYEPWHYRYVGQTLATELYNGGNWITLEEYFGIDSVYQGYN